MDHASEGHGQESLSRLALSATTYCLTGCAIGEVLGMVIATALGWGNVASIGISNNAFILLVPGAIAAGLGQALFWWSLAVSLLVAFVFAFPLNRWLIARGRGHAVIHAYHGH